MMLNKHKIESNVLVKMLQSENRAEYFKYISETESSLSQICDSADALGPLVISEKFGPTRLKLRGNVYYSRFRAGDRVELRLKKKKCGLIC